MPIAKIPFHKHTTHLYRARLGFEKIRSIEASLSLFVVEIHEGKTSHFDAFHILENIRINWDILRQYSPLLGEGNFGNT